MAKATLVNVLVWTSTGLNVVPSWILLANKDKMFTATSKQALSPQGFQDTHMLAANRPSAMMNASILGFLLFPF